MKPRKENEMATKKTEVAKAKNTALQEADAMFEQHAGEGLENVTGSDILVPRLELLQALSPQLKRRDPAFIPDGVIGSIADLGTGELFGGLDKDDNNTPIGFLPVHFSKVWIEWIPRENGGGLAEIHETDAIMAQCGDGDDRYTLPNGNTISETMQFFGLNLDAQARRCFVSFKSSQLKKGRKLNTLATSEKIERADGTPFTPPLFYRSYLLGAGMENKNQDEWAGWVIERGPKMTDLDGFQFIYDEAVAFRKSLIAGESKADNSDLEKEPDSNNDGRM